MDYDNDEPVKVIVRVRPEELDDGSSSDKESLSPLAKINNIRGHLNNSGYGADAAPIPKSVKFITQLNDQSIRIVAPYSDSGATGVYRKGVPAVDDKEFTFDKIYPENSKQEDIYAGVSNLVSATIRGYNATIFAYGCTGSGKSYTMTGTQYAPGIIPRVISDIFTSIEEKAKVESDTMFYIRISYVELYQNNFRNLLDFKKSSSSKSGSAFGGSRDSGRDDDSIASSYDDDSLQDTLKGASIASSRSTKIEVRENTSAGVFLAGPNLRIPVTSAKEAFQLIAKGNKLRAIGSTQCNEMSSRSHVVLTIHVESKVPNAGLETPKNNNLNSSFFADSVSDSFDPSSSLDTQKQAFSEREFGGPEWRLGKIHLVDLAGSERLSLSGAEGDTLLETQKINLALSALGDVLHALSKNSSIQMQHEKGGGYMMKSVNGVQVRSQKTLVPVPYRNSKLTHLLKDSLGGNSKTVMITTVRNNSDYYGQTLVSLSYAQRAKMVKNKSLINKSIGGDSGINAVAGEIERLKQRLEERTIEFDRLRDLQLEESNENLTLKTRFEELQRANDMEKKELESQLSNVIHSQAGQLASQKQKILSLQNKLQDELSNAQNRIAEQEKEIKWLKKELDESAKSALKPQEQLQKMQKLIDSWQSQVESIQAELSTAVKANTSLRAKVTALTNDLSASEITRRDLQGELNSRNNEINDLTLVMTQKERYCESLEKDNESLNLNKQAIEKEKLDLQIKYKSLEGVYYSLDSKSNDFESKIRDLTRKNREIDKEKEDLKDKLTNMIGVLEKKSSSVVNEASIRIQDAESKLRTTTLELHTSNAEMSKLKAELKEFSSGIGELQSQIEIEKQSNLSLRTYNEKLVDLLKTKDSEVVLLTTAQSDKEAQIREELAETCIQEMSKLKSEFSSKEERFKQEWIERERQLKEEMSEFKNITSEVEVLKKKYEVSLKSVTAEGEKKLHDTNLKAEQTLTTRMNELKEIFSTTYKKLQEETETKINDAVKAEKFLAAKKLETKVAELTDKMKREHHAAQLSLENAFRLEIAGLKSMHASELATAVELLRTEEASNLNAEIVKLNSIWEAKVGQIVTEYNEKVLSLETMLLQTKDQSQIDMKSALDALKIKFEAKYKQKLDLLKAQETEIETKYKNMIGDTEEKLKSELEGALRSQREKLSLHHSSEIESVKKMHSSELKLLESKYESEVRNKDKEVQSLKVKHENNVQELDSNWKMQLYSAKQMLEHELNAQFDVRMSEAIHAAQDKANNKLEHETGALTSKINALVAEKLEIEEKMSDLQEQHRKEKLLASRQNYEEMEQLESKYFNELKSQKRTSEDSHEKQSLELQSEISRLKLEYSELKNTIALRQSLETKAQKEQREEYDKLLSASLSDRDENNKKILQALRGQHVEEIDRFKATLDSVKERYESEIQNLTTLTETHRSNIAALNSHFENEKSRMREESQHQLAELSIIHKKELQDLKIQKEVIEAKMNEIIKESKDQNHELNMSMSKLRSQLESEKYQVSENAKLELSAVEGKHRASLTIMEMKQQDEIDSIHASYKLKLKVRQAEFEAELERQDALHKKSTATLQDEEKSALQRLQVEHRREVDNINSAHEKTLNSLKLMNAGEMKTKVDELELAFSAKRFELIEDHKREVQKFDIEVRNLQTQVQELTNKLSDSKREEMQLSDSRESLESNITRLLRETESLKETNKLEVETLRERFQFEKAASIEKLNIEHNSSRESLMQENLSKLELYRQQHELELRTLRRELSEQSERKQQSSAEEIKRLISKHVHEIENIRVEAKSKFEDKLVAEKVRFENERNALLEQQRNQLSGEHSRILRDKAKELEDELAVSRKAQVEHRAEVETLIKDGSHSRQIIENLNSKITDLKIELDQTKKINAAEIEFLKTENFGSIEKFKTKLLEEKQKDLHTKEGELASLRERMIQEDEKARSNISCLRDDLNGVKLKCEALEAEKLRLIDAIAARELEHSSFIDTAKKLELVAKENMRQELAEHLHTMSQRYEKQILDIQSTMQSKLDGVSMLQRAASEKFDALELEYDSVSAKLEAALLENERADAKYNQSLADQQQSLQGGYFSLLQGQVDSILNMIKLQSQNLPQVEEMQHKFLVMLEDLPEVWHEKHGIKKEVLSNLKTSDIYDESKALTGAKKIRTPIYLLAGSQVDKDKDREKENANQAAAQAKLRAFSQINSSINNPGSMLRGSQAQNHSSSFSSSSSHSHSHSHSHTSSTSSSMSMPMSSSTSHWQAAPVSPGQMSTHSDQLISAILDGDVQGIRAVIRSKGDNLNSEYWKDLSKSLLPLHRAISGLHFHGNERLLIATIECLCQLGSDINAADQSGNTVLHKAIQICTSKSVAAVVRCLMQRGADPMRRNKDNEIALHSECKRVRVASVEVIEILLNAKSDPTALVGGTSALTIVLFRGATASVAASGTSINIGLKAELDSSSSNASSSSSSSSSDDTTSNESEEKSRVSGRRVWVKAADLLVHANARWDKDWRSESGLSQLHLLVAAFPPYKDDAATYLSLLSSAIEGGLSPLLEDVKGRNAFFMLCIQMASTPLESFPNPAKVLRLLMDSCPGGISQGSSDRSGHTIFDIEDTVAQSCLSSCRHLLISSPNRQVKTSQSQSQSQSSSGSGHNSSQGQNGRSLKGFPSFSGSSSVIDYKEKSLNSNNNHRSSLHTDGISSYSSSSSAAALIASIAPTSSETGSGSGSGSITSNSLKRGGSKKLFL